MAKNQLSATFLMRSAQVAHYMKEFETKLLRADHGKLHCAGVDHPEYDGCDFDNSCAGVVGPAQLVMAFIGFMADSGEDCLHSVSSYAEDEENEPLAVVI